MILNGRRLKSKLLPIIPTATEITDKITDRLCRANAPTILGLPS